MSRKDKAVAAGRSPVMLVIFVGVLMALAVMHTAASARTRGSLGAGEDLLAEPVDMLGAASADREAKSLRYNGGQCDITKFSEERHCFFDQYESRGLPLIPTKLSAIVAVGRAVNRQGYLSADRTHIYTEVTLDLDEVFKGSKHFGRSSGRQLIVDQMGGELTDTSGRVLRDETRSGFMAKFRIGGRYLLFVHHIHKGKDLEPIMAYELRGGKVYKLTEDGSAEEEVSLSGGGPGRADGPLGEQGLLQAVRRSIKQHR